MRKCKHCQQMLPATDEYFIRKQNVLRFHACRCCINKRDRNRQRSAYQRKHRMENVTYYRDRDRKRRAIHRMANTELYRERGIIKTNRRRALKQGNGGTYTELDIKCKLQLQGHRCYWCKTKFGKYTVDHYIPLTRGGSNWPDNIVMACQPCNSAKGNKLPEEFYAYLAQQRQLEFTV